MKKGSIIDARRWCPEYQWKFMKRHHNQRSCLYVRGLDLSIASVSANLNPHNFSLAVSFTIYFDFRVVIGTAYDRGEKGWKD